MKKIIFLILLFLISACNDEEIAAIVDLKGDCKSRAVHTATIAIHYGLEYEIVYGFIFLGTEKAAAHLATRVKICDQWLWIELDDKDNTTLYTNDQYSDFTIDTRYEPYDIYQVIERTRTVWRR